MKEAVVAYSLHDVYAMQNQLPALDTPLRRELRKDSALWKKSMVRATSFLRDNLHQANPLVAEMIKIWHRDYEYVYAEYSCGVTMIYDSGRGSASFVSSFGLQLYCIYTFLLLPTRLVVHSYYSYDLH